MAGASDEPGAGDQAGDLQDEQTDGTTRLGWPLWLWEVLDRSMVYLEGELRLQLAGQVALGVVARSPSEPEVMVDQHLLPDTTPTPAERREARVQNAEALRSFAAAEVDAGYPRLNGHTVVAAWAALEAFVTDLVTAWVLNVPHVLGSKALSRMKVPLATFIQLDDVARAEVLVDEIERSLNANLRSGVTRFETLLEVVGLEGQVDKQTKRDLFEMQQVRNVILHRGGVVDRRLAQACPWLKLTVGERVQVRTGDWGRYYSAALDYFTTVGNRCRVALGLPVMPGFGSGEGRRRGA